MSRVADALPLPEVYYFPAKGKFLMKDYAGCWIEFDKEGIKNELIDFGYDSNQPKIGLSPVKKCLSEISKGQNVAFAGSLAGYSSGVYKMNGKNILVTDSLKLIEPKEGEWPMVGQILNNMFNHGGIDQRPYLFGWLHQSLRMYYNKRFLPGQALVLAGPVNSGKTLLQSILTEVFGGRCAQPHHFMTGGTEFNSDIFGSEHLAINDEVEAKNYTSRRQLGAKLKQIAVEENHRCHPKQKDAVILKPFWRLSIAVNDDPERLGVIPPMDGDLVDKLMLFSIAENEMPMPTGTETERGAFWKAIEAELPAFRSCDVEL